MLMSRPLRLEAVLVTVVHATTRGHVWVHGPAAAGGIVVYAATLGRVNVCSSQLLEDVMSTAHVTSKGHADVHGLDCVRDQSDKNTTRQCRGVGI